METLWTAAVAPAVLCWLVAQLIASVVGWLNSKRRAKPLSRFLNLVGSSLYVVALILLIQTAFVQPIELFLLELGSIVILTLIFGLLRYYLKRRSTAQRQQKRKGI